MRAIIRIGQEALYKPVTPDLIESNDKLTLCLDMNSEDGKEKLYSITFNRMSEHIFQAEINFDKVIYDCLIKSGWLLLRF